MDFKVFFCLLFSGISMIMDIKREKVSNGWILTGIVCSAVLSMGAGIQTGRITELAGMAAGLFLPLALLFPLFLGKMLGTGDIKVFAVLGSLMGGRWILRCMFLSFLIGAIEAVPILFFRCNGKERFSYFFTYLNHVWKTKTFPPYLAPGKHPENIHFTIPIFLSVILCILRG